MEIGWLSGPLGEARREATSLQVATKPAGSARSTALAKSPGSMPRGAGFPDASADPVARPTTPLL
ncbi:hypothetical protein BO85DRAFT_446845, partial [Aspergillus piperis CBS 112811]